MNPVFAKALESLTDLYEDGTFKAGADPEAFFAEVAAEIEKGREIRGTLGKVQHLIAMHWKDEGAREHILKISGEALGLTGEVPARAAKGGLAVPDEVWRAFHRAWTTAVGTEGYNKEAWKKAEGELIDRYRAGVCPTCGFAKDDPKGIYCSTTFHLSPAAAKAMGRFHKKLAEVQAEPGVEVSKRRTWENLRKEFPALPAYEEMVVIASAPLPSGALPCGHPDRAACAAAQCDGNPK